MGTSGLGADNNPNPNPFTIPWAPFATKADFEFSELVIQDNCSISSIQAHIQIHQQSPKPAITFKNYKEFKDTLDNATKLLTDVCWLSNWFSSVKLTQKIV